jgi:hypothetical protein
MDMRNIYVCVIGWILFSCSDTLEPGKIGFNYFPLEIGDYRIYQVQRIEYSLFATTDTAHYQLKELVVDTFSTQSELNYILHRFKRDLSTDKWQLDSVWTSRRTQNHAIVVENNIPFVKMVFPIRLDKVWDGNLFNASPPDEYQITEIGGSLETPAGTFVDNLTVFENNEPDTLIFQDIRQSIYALNVGLIYKNSSILDFCNTDPDCLGTLEFGIKFDQVLTDYGKE